MQSSDLLQINRERILSQWEKEVRAKLSAATHENKSALRDSLPEFIDDIGKALTFGIGKVKQDLLGIAHKHGAERANLFDYTIEEALEEFNILRKVIFTILEENGPLSRRDRDIIYDVINIGFAKAGTEFANKQLMKEEEARKLADQRLIEIKKSEKKLHLITDIQPTLISYVDTNLRYRFVNHTYEKLLGKKRKDILGTTLKESLGEEAWVEIEPYIRQALNGEDAVFTKQINYDSGSRYVKVHYRPSFDDQKKVEGIYVSVMDITEQMETLESLHQEQALRDRLIHSLSHDLRTPLTAAKMAAQLMTRKLQDTEATLKQSERIISNIDRADKMIQDLLDASRIKAGQLMKPTIQKFDLEEVVNKSLEDLVMIYGERFDLFSEASIEVYSWDQGIMRILDNLCSNAIKYGDPTKNVNVKLKKENSCFVITIHNYGKPIEKDFNLFDEFQRASSAEDSGKKGWGIGLTIVRGISESIGGDVRLKRHQDGTTFEVYLPIDSRGKIPTNTLSSRQH